jgi:hypothetical protein
VKRIIHAQLQANNAVTPESIHAQVVTYVEAIIPERELGFQSPTYKQLKFLAHQVKNEIYAYCSTWVVVTLSELEQTLCRLHKVGNFESLKLGPLLRQPCIIDIFHPSAAVTQVPQISTQEVVEWLYAYRKEVGFHASVAMEAFVSFCALQRGLVRPEDLCITLSKYFVGAGDTWLIASSKKCMIVRLQGPSSSCSQNARSTFTLRKRTSRLSFS